MADLKYRVDIETKRARAGLVGLQSATSSLTAAFTGLIATIGAVNLARFADSVTNAANRLRVLSPAQADVNRQFETLAAIAIRARTPLEQTTDLYFRIARAADQLGISQQEAASITESVAKALVASGISAQEASGPLLQLGQALQSGRFQGDELRSILEGLPPVAQALADKLGVPIGALRELGSQGKITSRDFVEAMREARDSIEESFGRTAPTFGQSITQLQTAFALLIQEIQNSTGIGEQFSNIILFLVAQLRILSKDVDSVIGPIKTFIKVVGAIISFTIVGRVIRGLAAAFAAAKASLTGFLGLLGSAGAAIGTFLGIEEAAEAVGNIGKEGTESAKIIADLKKELEQLATSNLSTVKPSVGKQTDFVDPTKLEQARTSITKITEEYKRSLATQQKRLELDNSLIGATEKQRAVKTALADLEEDYLRTVTNLQQKYKEASISGKEEDKAKMQEITEQLKVITGEYKAQIGVVQSLTEQNFALNESIKQRQALADFTLKTELDLQKKIRDIQHDMATSTMTAIEKKYADIAFAAQESARSAIEAENQRRRSLGLTKLTAAEEQKYFEAAKKGNAELMAAEKARFEQTRTFEAGWKRAMDNYVDDATNAAKAAERVFQKATQGMEDAIVGFAKTGKFEFKQFLSSIVEELLRSQIRQLLANVFSTGTGGGGGGSGLGAIGKLLGFANGGIIPTNAPVVVGERGPELLVGARGNRVIPNDQLGGAANVTYNINAVDARSFKEMVARDPAFLFAVTEQGRRRLPGAA